MSRRRTKIKTKESSLFLFSLFAPTTTQQLSWHPGKVLKTRDPLVVSIGWRRAQVVPVFATDFNRYSFTTSAQWRIIFPYEVGKDECRLLSEHELKQKFPKAYAYLKSKQTQLKQRKQYAEWFGYSAPRNLSLHDRAHIAVPLLADHGIFTLIPEETRGRLCPMASGGFTITLAANCPLRPEYVLGLLNSRLLFWNLQQMSNIFRGGWITCTKQYFGKLPIANPDKTRHDEIVASHSER